MPSGKMGSFSRVPPGFAAAACITMSMNQHPHGSAAALN
jgi:hypothetical protein